MPELDYMVLADYVRQDSGVTHIMAAGVDTIIAPAVPTRQQFGIALRITFGTTEMVGEQHHLTVTFVGPDQPVLTATGEFVTPPRPEGVPDHWRTAIGVALQMLVPLPTYGDYSCELDIDNGAITKSLDFRVVAPQDQAQS
jgi:hypothetical protein